MGEKVPVQEISLETLDFMQNCALQRQREYIIGLIREEFADRESEIADLIDRIRGYGADPNWMER